MDLFTLSASLGLDITGFQSGISLARNLLRGFADAVVDFGRDVMDTGIGFDRQMSAVQAVMGLTENTAENLATMNKLREFALEQARDSIFTSEEAATAYYYMGMAGWRAEEMVAGLPGVMALAAASGEDLKMTSDMVTDSLTAFGYGADQATHFADVLAVTATNANTDVARMQQTFKNLAPIAGTLGYSIEDVALSVGLIANSGIKGSQAGTALRNIFTRIATNAGATSNTLGALSIITDKLGVSFYDAEGKARDWGDVLTEVRAAWAGMDEETREGVIRDFDSTVKSSEEAKIALKEFATDVEEVQNIQSKLAKQKDGDIWDRYAKQIGEIGKQYDDLLTKLGISIPKQPEEYADALEQARIKLGLMSDQEQIYYGKQIGSLRGISGWLAMMTASEEDVNQLTTAIQNADGAARAMADIRLDNLWGDTARFNAELDVLKIALYDDVKSPLRDVVQYATGALKNVTDAVNENGLLGGIQQLGEEIRNFTDEYKDEIEAFGEAITPILTTFIDTITPAFLGAASALGSSFIEGVIEGAIDYLDKHSVGPLGTAIRAYRWLTGTETSSNTDTDNNIEVQIKAKVDSDTLVSDIDDAIATAAVGSKVKIGSLELDSMAVADLLRDLESKYPDFRQSGVTLGEALGYGMNDGAATEIDNTVDAVSSASIDVAQRVFDNMNTTSEAVGNLLATDISNAGVDGGYSMAGSVLDAVMSEGTNITNAVYNSVSDAGDAGWDIASSIQHALDFSIFTIKVTGVISNIVNRVKSFFNMNASAMSSGRIYTKPTVFGYANGAYQVAGDVGPEAVVGVNSLQRMITNAVRSASAGQEIVVPRNEPKQVTIILELDHQQMGKAVYKLNNEETQRVGVRLANGGAY